MEAGTICETDETGETAIVEQIGSENAAVEKIESLTGLTGLPASPVYLQKWHFEAGEDELTLMLQASRSQRT